MKGSENLLPDRFHAGPEIGAENASGDGRAQSDHRENDYATP
jgi:hypothetical protein